MSVLSEHSMPHLAASYGRKSDHNDVGIDAQHLLNEQRARKDGYIVPDRPDFRFGDDATSGVTKSRGGLDTLIALVKSDDAPFTRVYVKDKTRLGRWNDPRYHFYLQVLFEEHGVRIVFSENDRDIDYAAAADNPEMIGLFMKEAVDGVVASEERKRLIRRITGGMRTHVLNGFFPGSSAPYGMQRWLADERTGELLELIPDGQAVRRKGCRYKLSVCDGPEIGVVRRVYDMLVAGHSLNGVAKALNATGLPTPSGKGRWRSEAVRRIARNPIYCGDLLWGRTTRSGDPVAAEHADVDGREAILFRDFLPDAPIARDLWNDVQDVLEGNREVQRRRRAASPDYLLTGLVHCSDCDGGWYGHTSTVTAKSRRRYYRHTDLESDGPRCSGENRYLRAEAIEDQVLAEVARVLSSGTLHELTRQAIATRLAEAESRDHAREEAAVVKRLARYEQALSRAIDQQMLADTEAASRAFASKVQQYARQVDQLRSELSELQSERLRVEALGDQTSALLARSDDLLALLESGAAADRKEVVAAVIHGIRISPDVSQAELAVRAL
jgi:hypothetical protein